MSTPLSRIRPHIRIIAGFASLLDEMGYSTVINAVIGMVKRADADCQAMGAKTGPEAEAAIATVIAAFLADFPNGRRICDLALDIQEVDMGEKMKAGVIPGLGQMSKGGDA